MILDKLCEIADNVALSTAGTGRQVIGDQIDIGSVVRNIGSGEQLYFNLVVTTAFTSGGSATVVFELVSDSTAALATDGSSTLHASTASLAVETLVAGYRWSVALPVNGPAFERYLGLVANVGTAALTAGRVDGFLTIGQPANWRSYPDATN